MKVADLDHLSQDDLESAKRSLEDSAARLLRYIAWLQDENERVKERLDTFRDEHEAKRLASGFLASQVKRGVDALDLLGDIREIVQRGDYGSGDSPLTRLTEIRHLLTRIRP